MFRLGLQVLRTRWDDAIDAVRFRRALVVAVSVAVLLTVVLIVLQLTTQRLGSETAQAAAVALSCAVAGGSLVAACMPWASRVDPAATINGRAVRPDAQAIARGSVQLYVQRRPRPVRPEDREAVLNDVPLLHRGLIRRCVRMTALSVAVAL